MVSYSDKYYRLEDNDTRKKIRKARSLFEGIDRVYDSMSKKQKGKK